MQRTTLRPRAAQRRVRRLLAATALFGLVATSSLASSPTALAADPVSITPEDLADLLSYQVNTTVRLPSGFEVTRTTPGAINTPIDVDVDGADHVPELNVNVGLAVDPSNVVTVDVDVKRLVKQVPVAVEVVLDLPGEGDPQARDGYDARTEQRSHRGGNAAVPRP